MEKSETAERMVLVFVFFLISFLIGVGLGKHSQPTEQEMYDEIMNEQLKKKCTRRPIRGAWIEDSDGNFVCVEKLKEGMEL